jgi:hypothetical protein
MWWLAGLLLLFGLLALDIMIKSTDPAKTPVRDEPPRPDPLPAQPPPQTPNGG